MCDERARGLCRLDDQNSPDAIFRLAERSKTRPLFELMAYSGKWSPGAFILFRRSFLFAFTLSLLCAAHFLVALKKGAGLSTEISLIIGGSAFSLFLC